MSINCSCKNKDVLQTCTCKTGKSCLPSYDYLKPMSYDDLFDEKATKCSDYSLIMKKLCEARSSFFMFQTSIYNFINDCTKLKQRVREEISGNELLSLTYEYRVLLNNLISQIALGMRKKIKDDNSFFISFEVPETRPNKTIDHATNLQPTDITYTDIGGVETLITSLPSITLYLCDNLQLQVRITTPKGLSYSNLTFDSSFVKTFHSKENDVFVRNMTPSLSKIKISDSDFLYGFTTSNDALDILEDIIKYASDNNIITHELKDVNDRLNSIITSIENSHRSVVQKVKTENLTSCK